MILYHGSFVEIKSPAVVTTDKGRDFGPAFYLTPIKEQAERMAKRKQKITKCNKAFVTVFEWDENKEEVLYKRFDKPDLEWLDMIIKCRSDGKYIHSFDIVEGKIADDSVGETILFVMDGIITKEEAIKRLKYQKINSQIAFCTEESIRHLKYVKSYEVK